MWSRTEKPWVRQIFIFVSRRPFLSYRSITNMLKTNFLYQRIRNAYINLRQLGSSEEHWARVVMNRQTQEFVNSIGHADIEALEISGEGWKEFPSFKSYRSVQYPSFDICTSQLDDHFDLIIAEQVFEHLLWPYRAGRNVFDMLRDGGYFLITTPFLLKVHPSPHDCSRWTETGLKYFLAECGFPMERIQTGSWGNRSCVVSNLRQWTRYRRFLHSLKLDYRYPIHVWAFAQK